MSRDAFFSGAFLRDGGGFVGQVYLGPVDWELPAFEVGHSADCPQEGKGFVTEAVTAILGMAFDPMAAHRISLRTDETNTGTQLVAQRCGFALGGQLPQALRQSDGSFSNKCVHGLLREESANARGQLGGAAHRGAPHQGCLDRRTTPGRVRGGTDEWVSGDVGP